MNRSICRLVCGLGWAEGSRSLVYQAHVYCCCRQRDQDNAGVNARLARVDDSISDWTQRIDDDDDDQ